MPKISLELDVEMDGGATHRVIADQRDFARWEVQDFADDDRTHLKARFLAWSSMTRQQLTAVTFARFNEVDCVEVASADTAEDEGDDRLDPGKPDPSGAL